MEKEAPPPTAHPHMWTLAPLMRCTYTDPKLAY